MLARFGFGGGRPADDLELLERDLDRTVAWPKTVVFTGLVAIVVWALTAAPGWAAFFGLFAGEALSGGAAAVAGAVAGFLFGVPRFARPDAEPASRARLAMNTNLVDVSDWLTKLLLGATLTQLGNIPGFVWNAAGALAQEGVPGHRAVTAAVLVYYTASGFLGFYLITQIYLTLAFKRANDFLARPPAADRLRALAERLRTALAEPQALRVAEPELRSELRRLERELGRKEARERLRALLGDAAARPEVEALLEETGAPGGEG